MGSRFGLLRGLRVTRIAVFFLPSSGPCHPHMRSGAPWSCNSTILYASQFLRLACECYHHLESCKVSTQVYGCAKILCPEWLYSCSRGCYAAPLIVPEDHLRKSSTIRQQPNSVRSGTCQTCMTFNLSAYSEEI